MGQIAICKDLRSPDGARVALKSLLADTSPSAELDPLLREAEAWLTLGSPELSFYLGLKEIASLNDRPYLVLPYCANGSLKDRLAGGPLPLPVALNYATQILIGLWQLEIAGIVHRDLKPSNVLFDSDDRIQLSDLGIARFRDRHAVDFLIGAANPNDLTTIAGTLPYMAPEQLLGRKDMDSRVDMWAFGVLCLEMLSGELPFQGTSAQELLTAIHSGVPVRMERLAPIIPEQLAAILSQLLQKRPADRFASIRALISEWDKVVCVVSDEEARQATDDERVPVVDSLVAAYWEGAFFPERLHDKELLSFSFSALKPLKAASGFYHLDQYDRAIEAADDMLGKLTDDQAPIVRLLRGELPPEATMERVSPVRSVCVPGAAEVAEAAEWRLKALVGLLSEPESKAAFAFESLAYARAFLGSAHSTGELQLLSCQLLALADHQGEARERLNSLLATEPTNARLWQALFLTATSAGDMEGAYDIAEAASKSLPDTGFLASHILAHMWALLRQPKRSIHYAVQALTTQPNDIETLYFLVANLINDGRTEEGREPFMHMHRIAPDHPKTLRLRSRFLNE